MAESLPWQAAELPADAVEVGYVQQAWGVRGWVRVRSLSSTADALRGAHRWYLQPPAPARNFVARAFDVFSGTVAVTVTAVRRHPDGVFAHLHGVDDRELAQRLRGARIFVARADFPPTEDPDEFYWVDLIGLTVVNREGVMLGVVHDLLPTGPHAVLC